MQSSANQEQIHPLCYAACVGDIKTVLYFANAQNHQAAANRLVELGSLADLSQNRINLQFSKYLDFCQLWFGELCYTHKIGVKNNNV